MEKNNDKEKKKKESNQLPQREKRKRVKREKEKKKEKKKQKKQRRNKKKKKKNSPCHGCFSIFLISSPFVISSPFKALGKSCLFAKIKRTASASSGDSNTFQSSSLASFNRAASLLSTTKITACVFKK